MKSFFELWERKDALLVVSEAEPFGRFYLSPPLKSFFISAIVLLFDSCSPESRENNDIPKLPAPETEKAPSNKGIGPVSSVNLGALDETLAASGKAVFESKCTACHKIESKLVGPPLEGVTKRRKPEWIMNMILNPAEMTKKDSIAKELLGKYTSQMTNQNLTQEEARAVLEFFRANDSK